MFFNATPCPSSVSSYQKNNKPKRCNQALFGLLVVGWLVLSAPLWAQTGSPVDADEEEEALLLSAVLFPHPVSKKDDARIPARNTAAIFFFIIFATPFFVLFWKKLPLLLLFSLLQTVRIPCSGQDLPLCGIPYS